MKSGKCQEKAWKVVEESVCVCLINVSGRYWGLMWLFFCKLLIYEKRWYSPSVISKKFFLFNYILFGFVSILHPHSF